MDINLNCFYQLLSITTRFPITEYFTFIIDSNIYYNYIPRTSSWDRNDAVDPVASYSIALSVAKKI